jgi:hypothetical protein
MAACQSTTEVQAAETVAPEAVEAVATAEAPLAQAAPSSQPTSAPTSQPSEPTDDETAGHFGAPFAIEGDPMPLRAALDTCAGTGEACKVEGTIERVCQSRGCWFTMAAPDVTETVRIRMVDYGFFVPRDAMGHHVVFEGTLQLEDVPVETAQHYADDEAAAGTAPARVVEAPERTYQFMITGAEISG